MGRGSTHSTSRADILVSIDPKVAKELVVAMKAPGLATCATQASVKTSAMTAVNIPFVVRALWPALAAFGVHKPADMHTFGG